MALCREMHHGLGLEAFEQLAHFRAIRDIGASERVTRVVRHGHKRVEIARIGQLVDHENLMLGISDDVAHQRGADEAGAAGHEDALEHQLPSYLNGETKSAKRPSLRSLSDNTTSSAVTGHSIASVGSFQIRPLSLAGA